MKFYKMELAKIAMILEGISDSFKSWLWADEKNLEICLINSIKYETAQYLLGQAHGSISKLGFNVKHGQKDNKSNVISIIVFKDLTKV